MLWLQCFLDLNIKKVDQAFQRYKNVVAKKVYFKTKSVISYSELFDTLMEGRGAARNSDLLHILDLEYNFRN